MNNVKARKLMYEIIKRYDFKELPSQLSSELHLFYKNSIPSFLTENSPENTILYSLQDTMICRGYERIVISDYGPHIEFTDTQVVKENIIPPGRKFWHTTNDSSGCTIYVDIMDEPTLYYISPFEVKIM
jgi:hypothetical protein